MDIKLPEKATERAVEGVLNALDSLFGPAGREFGAMIGEQMRYYRFKNFLKIIGRVEHMIEERGLEPSHLKKLPFGNQYTLLEKASFEEKPEVQEMWATLIANAIDPSLSIDIEKRIVDLLTSLSPAEAGLLFVLKESSSKSSFNTKEEVKAYKDAIDKIAESHWRNHAENVRKSSVQNLIRLRCIGIRPNAIHLTNRLFKEMPRANRRPADGSLINPKAFEKTLNEVIHLIAMNAGISDVREMSSVPLVGEYGNSWGKLELPEMSYILTPLGQELVDTCIDSSPQPPSDGN